jgi:hypothetical protein
MVEPVEHIIQDDEDRAAIRDRQAVEAADDGVVETASGHG